ncbi:DMT family transporter [Fluviispira sanaruensis]|uniref:Guanidinium exporter n=1 Tax=Fluviispira sanaruensis TaxID=2493639 RepID=A0A4P2VSC8_FLUSA|nr:multidrug efflux SMR transporter [Fluviispira sanaruensis]BBH51702.1 QacE family quaternary ammonium compound efflux SMR transporter [Fluviispira sanaruensis]
MAWVYLVIAGLFEVVWAVALKNVYGFRNIKALLITIIGMIISFAFLGLALKHLPIGTAYAIWTGIGAVGVAIYGIIFYSEVLNFKRIFCLILVLVGIFGLKVFS